MTLRQKLTVKVVKKNMTLLLELDAGNVRWWSGLGLRGDTGGMGMEAIQIICMTMRLLCYS